MDNEKNINNFFDIISEFNRIGYELVKNGDFKKAIHAFKLKKDFIRQGYDFNIISIERTVRMINQTNEIIRTLEFLYGVSNSEE